MPIFQLPPHENFFPDPSWSEENGLLAVGGDLSPERILNAYATGIFPWYGENDPILWWSPDPRMVLFPENIKVSRSMRPYFNQKKFRVTFDQDFEGVIRGCADQPRPGQDGIWLNEEMQAAYIKLHELGFAHSVEVWEGEELVGGMYGEALGTCYFGESMFARKSNASKFGFITLVKKLEEKGFRMIDCQIYTDHLASLGAEEIPRTLFLKTLEECLEAPITPGSWADWEI